MHWQIIGTATEKIGAFRKIRKKIIFAIVNTLSDAIAITLAAPAIDRILGTIWRGVETWGFHESPSYPHMYCFLDWRERMESSTEKTLWWNTIVIGVFLNLGSFSHECRQYQFLRGDNVTKGWRDFFQQESHQRI
jgi:hypothetical protein